MDKANLDKVNVGIIGVGYMGSNHLRVYSELKNCEVVGVVDPDPKALENAKRKFKINAYTNVHDFLKNERVDAVSIVVPTPLHFEIAKFFIERGVHVLVEKPITEKLEDAERLIGLAREHNVKLMVGHIERFNPMVKKVKDIIRGVGLNNIYYCSTYRLNPESRAADSAVIDLSAHDIDVLRYLLESNVVKIQADALYRDGIEKHVVATLEFACKIKAVINSSLLYPLKRRELVVLGKDILIEGNYMTQDVNIYQKGAVHESKNSLGVIEYRHIKPMVKKTEPLKLELKHFIDCVINDKEPIVNGEDGKKTLQVAMEIIKKCKEGSE